MGRVTWEPLDPYAWEQGAVSNPDKAQLTLQLGVMTNRTTIPQDADPFLPKDRILPFGAAVLGASSKTFPAAADTLLGGWAGVSQSRKAYDRNEAEFVGAFKIKGFYVEAQCIGGKVDPELKYLQGKDDNLRDLEFNNTGKRLQAGIFVIPVRCRWDDGETPPAECGNLRGDELDAAGCNLRNELQPSRCVVSS